MNESRSIILYIYVILGSHALILSKSMAIVSFINRLNSSSQHPQEKRMQMRISMTWTETTWRTLTRMMMTMMKELLVSLDIKSNVIRSVSTLDFSSNSIFLSTVHF